MLLQWAVPGSLIPLLSVHLEQSLGFGRIETAWCCATQAIAAIVSSLLAGQIADRWFPAEKAMAVYAGLAGLSLFLLAELTAPLSVFLVTLAFWLATGPMLLMGTTVCFSNLRDSPREFGPIRMWGTVGWMIVGWVVTAWLQLSPGLFSDRIPPLSDSFRIGGLIAFVLAAYALTLPPTPPRPRSGASRWLAPLQAGRLLRGRAFFVYCLCLLGTCLTFPLTTQNTPLLLDQVGVPRAWISAALTIAQPTEIGLLGLFPILLHRLGLRAMMSLGLVAWLIGLSVMAIGHPTSLVLGSLLLNGFFITGFMVAGQVYVDGLADDDLRASVQGLLSCTSGLGLVAGNLLAGGLREATGGDLPPTFAVGAGITAALLLLFLVGFRTDPVPLPRGETNV
jgi:predicted MFS family arabinose efflux permease